MSSIQNVLCPVDFSPAGEGAIAEAFACAHRQNAVLHLLHVDVLYDHDPYGAARLKSETRPLGERANAYFDKIIAQHGARGTEIKRTEVRALAAATGICDYAVSHNIDLIVTGSHGRRGIKHWLLGSVTEETIRHTPCPVLTVREARSEDQRGHFKRILVPSDLSAVADRTFAYARHAAAQSGGELLVLHVVNKAPIPDIYGWPSSNDWLDLARKSSQAHLRGLLKTDGPEVPVEIEVIEGTPHREITAYAQAKAADIILMPHHSNTQVIDYFIGSTTERVLREAPCPVLTIPVERLHY